MRQIRVNGVPYTPSKIVCVGQNYEDHIKEMGSAAGREPMIFLKPNSSVFTSEGSVHIPHRLGLLHYEAELCLMIGVSGANLDERDAPRMVTAAAVGLDMTLRDLQTEARKAGKPWDLSKAFDNAAVFGRFVPVSDPLGLTNRAIQLKLNGEIRQQSSTSNMLFSPWKLMAYVSRFIAWEPGDILMTGTPSGVGAVADGDQIDAEVEGLPPLRALFTR
jgi:2-keto-4-pentenoate hydratase/2-oxohepta-3-ene-1,7-dioic acid hydratase in catechol pathway